jgi:butyryl-CoA dehydrogenase
MGLLLPKNIGGLGHSYLSFAAAIAEAAQGCPSTGLCLTMHYSATAVLLSASPEQLQTFGTDIIKHGKLWSIAFSEPGAGSHFLTPECRASRHDAGYVLDGEKAFVTSASAADYILMNVVLEGSRDRNFTLFAVPTKQAGLSILPGWNAMGMRANDSRSVRLSGCVVPREFRIGEEHGGLALMRTRPPYVDLGLAADSVGIAQAALELASEHAKSRTIAGDVGPLAHYQSLRFALADMALAVESARLMVHRAAWLAENQPKEAAPQMTGAKCVANECATAVTSKAMRIIGGRGYIKGHPIERFVRDAHAGSLMAFTPEQARDMLGKALVGMDPRS